MINYPNVGRSLCFGLFFFISTTLPATSQQYQLEAGDRIRSQIVGVNTQPYVALVDVTGNVRLPYLGLFQAAGKTLNELIDDISLEATGRQIRVSQNGVLATVVLDEQDIFLDIESYRPVTVTGAVAAPGRIDFEPGLSARAAIGIAGGLSLSTQTIDPNRAIALQGRLNELRETQAWLYADLWRIDSLLKGTDAATVPAVYADQLKGRLDEAALDVVRERITNSRAQLGQEISDVEARITLTESRIAFLNTALAQYVIASENEDNRLADVQGLVDRGLTTANAVDSAQAGALNASSRVLTTEADLAQAEQQLQSLLARLENVDIDFRDALFAEKSRVERDLARNAIRIDSVIDEISLSARLFESGEDPASVILILYRRENGNEEAVQIMPSVNLQPGDVVEVVIDLE